MLLYIGYTAYDSVFNNNDHILSWDEEIISKEVKMSILFI